MKKLVIAAVAAASLGTVSASTSCASNFTGFYAGLNAGLNTTGGDQKVTDTEAVSANNGAANTTVNGKSFIGGLFAGYGMGIGSCAYVGGELYANFGNTNIKVLDTSDNHNGFFGSGNKKTINNTWNMGAKIRLGYTVSQNAMIFLGLGVENAKFQFKQVPNSGSVITLNKNVTSFAPSVGGEMFLTKNLFTRLEYTYVVGSNITLNGNPKDVPFLNSSKQTYKFNLSQQRFTLGLGYKF